MFLLGLLFEMFNHSLKTDLITQLSMLIGRTYVLTDSTKIAAHSKGFRFGSGEAIAVAKPATLLEMWQVLGACVKAEVAVIMQAANTGLTGGSTPDGGDYDRPIVIINTLRINQIQLIGDARQIVALPGSTLFGLEEVLAPYGREPHSVIGSSCIGASIVGGVCNNSGGALVQRGPAYTELSLFAQIGDDGQLALVNHLDIELGVTPEEILKNLDEQRYTDTDIKRSVRRASDNKYCERVRDIDASTPSRFNNDGRRLHDAAGCAGKIAVFAVRLDTFPIAKKQQVFYIGTNDTEVLATMRRHILSTFKTLPVSGEYLHRDYYDVCKKYGKDTFVVIDKLGSKYIPKLFSLKRYIDGLASRFSFLPDKLSDRALQFISLLLPNHLPKRMEDYRDKYAHHFILEMSDDGIDEARSYLKQFFKTANGDYFECTPKEGKQAILHRFVAGGAVGRYHIMKRKQFGAIMTVDIALPRNERKWLEVLPKDIQDKMEARLYCGHLFCHVMHQNYILKKGVDGKALKQKLLNFFDERGAEYPAEHNVGHEYFAKQDLQDFYKKLDPTNTFNPGIGKTSKLKNWSKC